jgi:hypothetical protein
MRLMAKWLVIVVICFVMIGVDLPPFEADTFSTPLSRAAQ